MTQPEMDAIEQALWEAFRVADDFDCSAARYISGMIEGFVETFDVEEEE